MSGRPPESAVPRDFTKPTTSYWQTILPPNDASARAAPPYRMSYPARLPDGRVLALPIRPVPDGSRAAASFIANHAAFAVNDALAAFMAALARPIEADIVVGLPALGLTFAPDVARRIGHTHYVPLGYSRKFWYVDTLSEAVSSYTTPGTDKKLFLDPNLVPRVAGQRVMVIDDAISSGRTVLSALRLLDRLDCVCAAIVVAMRQGTVWHAALAERESTLPARVHGIFDSPLLTPVADGWMPITAAPQEPHARRCGRILRV